MKRYFFSLALVLIIAASANAQFLKADVQVSGLTCSMCQLATEKAIKSLDFVNEVKPDLNRNVYVLTFKKDKNVSLDQIRAKVKGAGFSVSRLVATAQVNNLNVDDKNQYKFQGNTYQLVKSQSKTLNGTVKMTIIDKGFIPDNSFKKNLSEIKSPAYKSGLANGSRIYHVTI